jgi:hypothetical protein
MISASDNLTHTRPVAIEDSVSILTFGAQRVDELSRKVTAWLIEHPSSTALSLSHAAETRYVVRDPVSLAGPEPVVMYTALLLVRSQSSTALQAGQS